MTNLLPLLFLILIFSCSKDDGVKFNESVTNYANIETGNYWVYDWYELGETEELISKNDTVFILGDTLIAGKHYFLQSPHKYAGAITFLFDSINSIFTYTEKQIQFSLDTEQEQTLEFGSLAIGTFKLATAESISVPAGTFECLNWKGTIISKEDDYEYGERSNDNYYSENVGLVRMKTQFYSSPNDLEARLTSFGNLEEK